MADKDFSDTTWREWYDGRRNRGFDGLDRRLQNLRAKKYGDEPGRFALDLLGRNEGEGARWALFDDEYTFPEGHGDASESPLPERHMWYRHLVLSDDGTPTEYERPTAEGWES